MRTGIYKSTHLLSALFTSLVVCDVDAAPSNHLAQRDNSNPLNIDWGPAPPPEDGPAISRGALRDPAYLPAQVGGIIGSYALALVLVAITLLALSKRRREHLRAAEEPEDDDDDELKEPTFSFPDQYSLQTQNAPLYSTDSLKGHVRNFSYPSPVSPRFKSDALQYVFPPRSSVSTAPGINLSVDQSIVAEDREMAQQHLEEMYKHVMEHEAAKEAGVTLGAPPPLSTQQRRPSMNSSTSTLTKREKNKPSSLILNKEEKTQSRASSILSALRSPRKKKVQGISISSPIMTPMSGTFPRSDGQEMNAIPPRHYAPAAPPPVPQNQAPYGAQGHAPLTPDISPQSTQSIDGIIDAQAQARQNGHYRNFSSATTEPDPISAATESSTAPLVGLPTSPKPTVDRFPSLPSSPKPGASFSRANVPSAVRTGGSLPLRAYEPAILSPTTGTARTKQTVFERAPLSPGGPRTPWTGAPVPYTPYQPFSPVIPITPSLVTREDRKRMKRLEPKTPTMEMVKSSDEIW